MSKIAATMTSWSHRIHTVAPMILDFFDRLTIKPDIFYLWLATDEFPLHENCLPLQLLETISKYKVHLKWCNKNTYCHKRWNVYPEHYDDYVISIDDDCYYSPTIIEDSKKIVDSFLNTVCCLWWQFSAIPTYNNDAKIVWKYDLGKFSMRNWFTANVMIPPKLFPLEALDKDVVEYRDMYAKKHDEAWLIPYWLKHDITIAYVLKNYPFNLIDTSQDYALSEKDNAKLTNGYKETEIALYRMLKFTNMIDKYTKINKGYNYSNISKCI